MKSQKAVRWMIMLGLVMSGLTVAPVAEAHQPYCEDEDLTLETAWVIADPRVSTAFYGTLESEQDVDYFVLDAVAGQRVFLSITIPQIEGQAEFDPVIGVFGPGLADEVPDADRVVPGAGGSLLLPAADAQEFYEPFGGRYYWQRQEATVTLPEAARYVIAVWHPDGEMGRYTFVYGQREVLGGDYGCNDGEYWQPVGVAATGETEEVRPSLLAQLLRMLGGQSSGEGDHDHDDTHSH